MTFNLDFALFYAYTLCLFAFLAFWMIPELFRAITASVRNRVAGRQARLTGEPLPSHPAETRFEAFTRI